MTRGTITLEALLAPPIAGKKAAAVYSELKRRIMVGRLTHESPITEQSLAQDFSCSQGTIREVLLCLEREELVDRRGYQGTFVTKLSEQEALTFLRLRLALECTAIRQSIPNITPDKMARLRAIASFYANSRTLEDVLVPSEIDRIFHQELFSLSGMPALLPTLKRTLLQLHRFTLTKHHGHVIWSDQSWDPHRPILDALEQGDGDAAEHHLSRHIMSFFTQFASDVLLDEFGSTDATELLRKLA
ncbi:GntR family transcriptional regulator [Roseibium litorale]|uniref:GntR family transcriptional regulator n=1 Tax=Roseibium litorale TaxID=2803841 RepID=A0ABR9CRA4_9HYPH|nr:GntR family transcriptional regulator [Roseibium litorale]MBD8893203.1 GntR family transcriptional regulator [Roseibium litorale]